MPVTSREAMHNTIRSRFATLIETGEGVTTRYDNDARDTPTSGQWVLFTILPGASDVGEFGATHRYRTPGVCVASIFSPLGQGDRSALVLADAIVDAFRTTVDSGVHFRVPSIERLGVSGGAWYQVNVTIPWYADELVTR